jgi:hypothetical protein
MPKYPAYLSARHEDGRAETFSATISAPTPGEAIEEAYRQYLPRYNGEEGWTLAVAVDELLATPDESAGGSE